MIKNRPVWAEVDLQAIAHNMREIRRVTSPQAQVMAVVKDNAYGHGALEVSRVVLANGADRLAVATLDEAKQLRQGGIEAPIMMLGYSPVYQAQEIIELDIIQTVFERETAEALSEAGGRLGKKAKIHLKIDTGLARLGFRPQSGDFEDIKKMVRLPNLEIEGVFSHFAMADYRDKTYTEEQFAKFLTMVGKITDLGINIPIRHFANSAAIIDLPRTHLEMVRPGISLYGYYPSQEVNKEKLNLKPALSLKCEVAFCKQIESGSSVSYGCTYTAENQETIATLALGYGDGYTRLLSAKGEVLIKGQRAPLIGRVCMDYCMAKISGINGVQKGDEVVLIGQQGKETITADELAQKIGTISYEILCMINWRVPRIYLD